MTDFNVGKRNILKTWLKSGVHQLRLVVYPIIYRVLYIPGGAGFLPSTVVGCWVSIRYFQQKISSCCIPFWQTLGRYVAPHDQSCHIFHLYPLTTCGKIKLRILAINLGCKLMSSTFIPSTDCSVVKIFSSRQGRNKNKKMSPLCIWWSCGEH